MLQSCSKGASRLGERDLKKQRDLWSSQNSKCNSKSKELLPTEMKKRGARKDFMR